MTYTGQQDLKCSWREFLKGIGVCVGVLKTMSGFNDCLEQLTGFSI